jgi:hypothetical protein
MPVPKQWPGATVVLIGGGPSLTVADVELVEQQHRIGAVRAIAINNAYVIAPWADVLYAADAQWWEWHGGVPSFTGPKYSIEGREQVRYPDVQILRNTGFTGLELDSSGLRAGFNSGYQAVNLAVHFGATRILLLGFDLSVDGAKSHWFGDHPVHRVSPYAQMIAAFETLPEPLSALGVSVVNCSRRTALTCFPCASIDDALMERAA